ncbi:MAG: hypothetical protein QM504_05290 [Pseudomonadota bacterium]
MDLFNDFLDLFSSDDTINPATGLPMNGGIGGIDTSGKLFNSIQFLALLLQYYLFFYSHLKIHLNWSKLPSLDEYLESNLTSKEKSNISCAKCNSKSIKNWGVNSAKDKRRTHICNHCNSTLYKSHVNI